MSKVTPPAPPALPEDEGQPWDLSRLVASAAPPIPREEAASDLWPSPRQSYPLGEITVASGGEPRRRPRRGLSRGVQALVAFSVGGLVALVGSVGDAEPIGSVRGAAEAIASVELDAEGSSPAASAIAPAPALAEATSPPRVSVTVGEIQSSVRVDAEDERSLVERRDATAAPRRDAAHAEVAPPVDVAATVEVAGASENTEPSAVAPRPTIDTASASMDELIDHAVAHVAPLELPTHDASPAEAPEPAEDAPAAPVGPDREEARRVMEEIRPALAACAAGAHGSTQIQLSITPSGHARAIRVLGAFAGSAEGSCMARAARDARFSAHEGDEDVTLRYPYRF